MKAITIRELHQRTGTWARRTRDEGSIIITERGLPIATIVPYDPSHRGVSFSKRVLIPSFRAIRSVGGDVTEDISDGRERE
jgi:prevent-host-death family protein